MSDQPFVAILMALLNRPEFQEGVQDGIVVFEEDQLEADSEKAWTEDDIIEFVDSELSQSVYRREQLVERVLHWETPPYLMHLGFTISYLALMLSTKANQGPQGEQDTAC